MDTRTGEIMTIEEMEYRITAQPGTKQFYKVVPFQRTKPKTGRNEPCPCGSGKKFKKCCLFKEVT
jgi:uncharacterized protein YecA (UPF0149 family)